MHVEDIVNKYRPAYVSPEAFRAMVNPYLDDKGCCPTSRLERTCLFDPKVNAEHLRTEGKRQQKRIDGCLNQPIESKYRHHTPGWLKSRFKAIYPRCHDMLNSPFRDYLDHYGSVDWGGIRVLVSDPYLYTNNDFSRFHAFARSLGCLGYVSPDSPYHFATTRLALVPWMNGDEVNELWFLPSPYTIKMDNPADRFRRFKTKYFTCQEVDTKRFWKLETKWTATTAAIGLRLDKKFISLLPDLADLLAVNRKEQQ